MVKQPDPLGGVFRALADPTRRAIVKRLAQRDRTVTELAEPFKMSLAAISKHVKVLESAGLLRRTVSGRTHTCRLDPAPLAVARQWLEYYEGFWSDRLDALEQALESSPPETPRPAHQGPH